MSKIAVLVGIGLLAVGSAGSAHADNGTFLAQVSLSEHATAKQPGRARANPTLLVTQPLVVADAGSAQSVVFDNLSVEELVVRLATFERPRSKIICPF